MREWRLYLTPQGVHTTHSINNTHNSAWSNSCVAHSHWKTPQKFQRNLLWTWKLWIISPGRDDNKKYLKPPPRNDTVDTNLSGWRLFAITTTWLETPTGSLNIHQLHHQQQLRGVQNHPNWALYTQMLYVFVRYEDPPPKAKYRKHHILYEQINCV